MSDLGRFHFDRHDGEVFAEQSGEWVRYEDAAAEIARLCEENERLRKERDMNHADCLRPWRKSESEARRLRAWLERIEGGDSPCRDEEQLRQWAYEALTLGRACEGGAR